MKRGVFALISYILYTLFWVAITLLFHFGILTQEDAWQLGVAVVLVAFFELYTITMAIGCFILAILKLLHIIKGWFGCLVICMVVDFRIFVVSTMSIIYAFTMSLDPDMLVGTVFVLILPFILSLGSLISNVRSLRR